MADPYDAVHRDCVVATATATATAALARAYAALEPFAARVLRLAGVVPAAQISDAQVAALLDVPVHWAFFALDSIAGV